MLVNLGVRLGGGPLRLQGQGPTVHAVERGCWTTFPTPWRNLPAGEANVSGVTNKAGLPSGLRHPAAWVMPQKPGALSVYDLVAGSGALSSAIAGGRNGAATLAGSGDLTAIGQLVVSAAATLAGSGELSGAAVAFLNAAATLAGSGDLTGAATAIGHAIAVCEGVGDLSLVSYATGELAAEITPFTDLSPQSLAAAVWTSAQGAFLYAVAHNRVVTDPVAGTYTVYDEDDNVLAVADLWADADGTVPYSGSGAERRDRLA